MALTWTPERKKDMKERNAGEGQQRERNKMERPSWKAGHRGSYQGQQAKLERSVPRVMLLEEQGG